MHSHDDQSARPTVLIIEDESTLREAIADLINSDPTLKLVGAAPGVSEGIEMTAKHRPAVALVDVKMPDGGGPRAAREIRLTSPQSRILALSAYEDRGTVLQMLRAGASGYLLKSSSADEILAGVKRCAQGESVLSPELTADIIKELVASLARADEMTQLFADVDRIKSDLIQTLAHELRTPLTVIMGTVPILVGDPNAPKGRRDEIAGAMRRATSRLQRVAQNIGAAAQLELKGLQRQPKPVPVDQVAEAALDEFPEDRERFILNKEFSTSGSTIWADSAFAVRALVTVMENAVDFSPAETGIEIDLRRETDWISIVVSDRGQGVAAGHEQSIFKAFTQVDNTATRPHEGIGIGLYLARLIMDAHKGSIRVESPPEGGSAFVLTFPAAPV